MARQKAQSALEYIFATIAFTVVGIGVVMAMSTAAWNKAGVLNDYDVVSGSVNPNTLAGATLRDGVTENKVWPGVDRSYAGSWQNVQTMPLNELDPEELDCAETGFYQSRNSAVPNQGLKYQQQLDEQVREGGGESFWTKEQERQWINVDSRQEWANIDETNIEQEDAEGVVKIATEATEVAVEAGERSESQLRESFNEAAASNGAAGFILEDDYWRYNDAWANGDGHSSGYRQGDFPERD